MATVIVQVMNLMDDLFETLQSFWFDNLIFIGDYFGLDIGEKLW